MAEVDTLEHLNTEFTANQVKNAELSFEFGSDGNISSVEPILGAGGQGYKLHDVVEVFSPLQYGKGEEITLQAIINDPRGELDRVAFYVNGVEVNGTASNMFFGNVWTTSYLVTDLNPLYFSARALYGDERDDPPSNYNSCGCHKREGECQLLGQGYWGWKSSWKLQQFHRNTLSKPIWFAEYPEYWATPNPWNSTSTIVGGVVIYFMIYL